MGFFWATAAAAGGWTWQLFFLQKNSNNITKITLSIFYCNSMHFVLSKAMNLNDLHVLDLYGPLAFFLSKKVFLTSYGTQKNGALNTLGCCFGFASWDISQWFKLRATIWCKKLRFGWTTRHFYMLFLAIYDPFACRLSRDITDILWMSVIFKFISAWIFCIFFGFQIFTASIWLHSV